MGLIHVFDHVLDQLPDLGGDLFDLGAFLAQYGMAVFNDGQDHDALGQFLRSPTRSSMAGLRASWT